ncbi:MAG TPA: glycosyltransferase family 2 protein, partial [Longimicrobiales bacterium]
KLRQVMTEMQRDFQIIAVDDASTDGTPEVLNPYTRVLPLTLFRNEKTLGYAASLEMALREAARRSPYPKRDAVITLQADFTEDPDVVPALIKRIEAGADLVAAQPTLDEGAPPNVRRARRFFQWLTRGREWAQLADPYCGMRAYRVMTLKRALEARGTSRLLTWDGWAANAELLMQTLPHSRRSDVIETTAHYKRLQRASRFRFFPALSQVLGLRGGKNGPAAPVALPEGTIVVPGVLAVELATSQKREEPRRRHEPRKGRPAAQRGEPRRGEPRRNEPRRSERAVDARRSEEGRRPRANRPPREQQVAVAAVPVAETQAAPEAQPEKRRRRPRRRSRKPAQRTDQTQLTLEPASTNGAAEGENGNAAEAGAVPARKKSRRGRRGGRGRKRSPRPNAEGQIENNVESAPDSAGEAAQ